jgi:cysteine synthase A
MIHDSILGTIGRTPIVKLQRLAPAGVSVYVKCEFFNPASSVKDRLAIAIIEVGAQWRAQAWSDRH